MKMNRFLNWRFVLVITAITIVFASIFYTSKLASRLAIEERKKVALFAEGIKSIALAQNNEEISFATNIITQDSTIPRIITDEAGNIQGIKGIDTNGKKDVDHFLRNKIEEFKKINQPITVNYNFGNVNVYYGDSYLLSSLKLFPYAQIAIIAIFLTVVIFSITASNKSIQNQVWVGLSKETAHQLGTPISSIEAWLELIKMELPDNEYVEEMQKDVNRLKLVADRFGKIGSDPQMDTYNIIPRLQDMVDYMTKRAPEKVSIRFEHSIDIVYAQINTALFDWVIENLIRNSLDALDGVGTINIALTDKNADVIIDVIDNGKGIAPHLLKKVFHPGFTTKKRGWGLGLSLSKRIIEKYHHGKIFVKQSELLSGTTFRIILKKV
jgi:hypothetical protein